MGCTSRTSHLNAPRRYAQGYHHACFPFRVTIRNTKYSQAAARSIQVMYQLLDIFDAPNSALHRWTHTCTQPLVIRSLLATHFDPQSSHQFWKTAQTLDTKTCIVRHHTTTLHLATFPVHTMHIPTNSDFNKHQRKPSAQTQTLLHRLHIQNYIGKGVNQVTQIQTGLPRKTGTS